MPIPDPLPDELVELMARRFRAMSEPVRIRILLRVCSREASVNDLAHELGASQQNVSKHLAVLADSGLVGRRKDGTRVYYRIVDNHVEGLCEDVCGSVQEQLRALSALVEGSVG